jgi:hypothetical protein
VASFNVFTITAPSGTGSQTHAHGLGEAPKALLVFGTDQTSAAASAANANFMVGFGDDSGEERANSGYAEDNVGTSVTYMLQGRTSVRPAFILSHGDGTGAINCEARLTSVDSTNVTLQWQATTSGTIFFCLAIGGSGVEAKCYSFIESSGSVPFDQAITGVGFQPDVVFFTGIDRSGSTFAASSWVHSFGVGDSSNEGAITFNCQDGTGTNSNDKTSYWNDRAFGIVSTTGSLQYEFSVKSLDSDGFTVTYKDQNPAAGAMIPYLAISGVDIAINPSYDQPSSTGTDDCTLTGITPEAVVAFSWGHAGTGQVTSNDSLISFGAATSSSNRACAWAGVERNVSTSNTSQDQDNTKLIKLMSPNGSSPTTEAAADLDSFASGKAVFDWTTADATARRMCVIGFASEAAPASEVFFENRHPIHWGMKPQTASGMGGVLIE